MLLFYSIHFSFSHSFPYRLSLFSGHTLCFFKVKPKKGPPLVCPQEACLDAFFHVSWTKVVGPRFFLIQFKNSSFPFLDSILNYTALIFRLSSFFFPFAYRSLASAVPEWRLVLIRREEQDWHIISCRLWVKESNKHAWGLTDWRNAWTNGSIPYFWHWTQIAVTPLFSTLPPHLGPSYHSPPKLGKRGNAHQKAIFPTSHPSVVVKTNSTHTFLSIHIMTYITQEALAYQRKGRKRGQSLQDKNSVAFPFRLAFYPCINSSRPGFYSLLT